ncbi:hypothetical protein [Chryseobacterium indoltheticum]|uniref:hypothetical protein n=1 Tax=Chryseobacterium indoltheticum TaxID=254 RepID=UPI000F4E3035|nr:hypothetical protein [Chryseobacterium indoltheticum]
MVSLVENEDVLEITDANDYYPFGMNHLKTGNAFFGGSTTVKNSKRRECMIMARECICRILEDGVL